MCGNKYENPPEFLTLNVSECTRNAIRVKTHYHQSCLYANEDVNTPESLTYNRVDAREMLIESKRIIINQACVTYMRIKIRISYLQSSECT